MTTTIDQLAAIILEQTQARLKRAYPSSPQWEWERVQVKAGPKYTKIDRGPEHNMSGMLMIDNATGEIFGIKGYGRVHKGHRYGTLATVDQFDWSNYYPERITEVISRMVDIGAGDGWLVRHRGFTYVISQSAREAGVVQAFRWDAVKGCVTDWDDLAECTTREDALAALAERPVDEDGRVLSRHDVMLRQEAAEDAKAESGMPVDPELFARTAPAWNCVSYPGEGMHYFPAVLSPCAWCGKSRKQIADEKDACDDCGCPAS